MAIKSEHGQEEGVKFIDLLFHRIKFLLNINPAFNASVSIASLPAFTRSTSVAGVVVEEVKASEATNTTTTTTSATATTQSTKSDPESKLMKKIVEFLVQKDLGTHEWYETDVVGDGWRWLEMVGDEHRALLIHLLFAF